MVNEIAPPADLRIDERIEEIEKFLEEEEKKPVLPFVAEPTPKSCITSTNVGRVAGPTPSI